jgi:hypothetical protein
MAFDVRNKMKTLLISFIIFLSALSLRATPQAGDQLALEKDKKVWIHKFTLSEAADKKLDDWKEAKGYSGVSSTANYDGFYASLELREGKLFLTKLSVDAHSEKIGFFEAEVPLSEIFAKKDAVPADWFSGELWEFYGESKGYTHFKSDVRIYVIEKGRLVETKEKKSTELK